MQSVSCIIHNAVIKKEAGRSVSEGDLTAEAEVGMMWGQEPRNEARPWKLEKTGKCSLS